jgi:hypothetical protein
MVEESEINNKALTAVTGFSYQQSQTGSSIKSSWSRKWKRAKGLNFVKAKMIFSITPSTAAVSHKYIDGTSTILLVVETIKKVTVAGDYSGVYTKVEQMIKPALLISLPNNEFLELYTTAVKAMANKYEHNQRLFRWIRMISALIYPSTYVSTFFYFNTREISMTAVHII